MGVRAHEPTQRAAVANVQPALLSLPFDHYQRYQLTGRAVSVLSPPGSGPLRILDVGGNSSSLKHFLPDHEIVLADIQSPPPFTYREGVSVRYDSYILAVGGHLPFADGSFDIVTAHDTLEHVPEENRAEFLRDLVRVSSRYVIVNGPVYHPETERAERRLALFMDRAFSGSNPSLDEHISLGLPRREVIARALAEQDLAFVTLPNGNLQRWLAMMAMKHYLMAFPTSEAAHEEVDRAYNALISEHDFGGLCYREAYIISLRSADFKVLENAAAALQPQIGDPAMRPETESLEGVLASLEEHASSLRGTLAQQQRNIDELHLAESALRTTTDALRSKIYRQEVAIRDREARLVERQAALEEANAHLATIQGWLGYRLLTAYQRRMRWLFPPGSRRGLPYRALRRGAAWALFRAPWRHVGRRFGRISSLPSRSRKIIRREGWRAFLTKARRKLGGEWMATAASTISYEQWIAANEPDSEELERQSALASKLPYRPLISIITPVWNPLPAHLQRTIESVLAQTYDNWELCLVDGGSRDPAVRQVLEHLAAGDEKIRVKLLENNLGISGNSNAGLALASGEFVAFLDHTDLLEPNALWEVVSLLNRNPALDCIYSDEDFVSEDGAHRFHPLFKPQWSPDIMLSANYLAHFRVLRRSCVEELGGERSETDGAQDWDLLLRLSEKTQRISRIPRVLYHWRADSTSAAGGIDNKPYALGAQIRAVQGHLDRRGMIGRVEQDERGVMRVRWLVSGNTRVSIIIPTKHNRKLLERCLKSIARSKYQNWEIIVVETAGRNPDRERWYESMKRTVPLTVLWWDRPFNYSAVNNHGASVSQGEALLFLNDDTEALSEDWLEEMVGWLEQTDIGVVGARLLAPDGTIQHAGDIIGLGGFASHLFTGASEDDWSPLGSTNWYRNLLAVTGACLMTKRELFETVGGFDESFILCGSDVELCLRIHGTGHRIVCTPFARLLHHERATRKDHDDIEDCFTSFWPYQRYLHGGDPYWSPNLSPAYTIPQLRSPEEPPAVALVGDVIGRNQIPSRQSSDQIEAEAASLIEVCQLLPGEIEATQRLHDANAGALQVRSINWFIPDFVSPFYGGIHTVFRLADYLKRAHGVRNRFIVLGTGPEPYVRSGLSRAFPDLGDAEILVHSIEDVDIEELPEADAAIATLWVTAYVVSKFQKTRRKFYMVQDFEPVFYPAGTLYALCEATYRLGLYGLANTGTLKQIYESDYGGNAFGFTPCVDTDLFHPGAGPRAQDEMLTVFLYGRPSHWRNCYELAMAAIQRLKRRLKRPLRVVTAGSWAPAGDSESAYLVDNLGLLDYKETANLYRSCDVGLALSVSKHPSYIPLELMASGALVVSNVNQAGSWLLHDGENCLLAEPTAESLSAALERGLLDAELRQRLTAQALKDIQERHSDWASQMSKIYAYMCDPEGA